MNPDGLELVNEITVGQLLTIVMLVTGAVGAVIAFFKKILPFANTISEFLEDWKGEAARPGRDRRPGVMEQIQDIKHTQRRHGDALRELMPNHGTTIKDKVTEVSDRTIRNEEKLMQLEQQYFALLHQLVVSLNLDKVERIETQKSSTTFMELISEEQHKNDNSTKPSI